MDLSIRFLILILLGLVLGGNAQVSPQAELLLDQTEAILLELVNEVQANDFNSCELLSTCNAESTCSRLSCPLTSANTTGYECQEVLHNTNCNCPRRNFDFSRSFLRVPGVQAVTENYITQRQRLGICAQRKLDNLFQKHSNNTNFFRLYFGSVDGTIRIFPGMDEEDCSSYDPRTRLWYLQSTTNVNNLAVMVLIDSGSSMGRTLPAGSLNNLIKASNIIESFLNTTTNGDYVNIFSFDHAKVKNFSAQPVPVTDTSTHPDFGVFTATLSAANQSSVPPGNITEAISYVITSPAGFGSTEIPSDFLKVIILLTDSEAVNDISNAAIPWDLIKNNNISVFLYMFPSNTPAIDASPLASQLCAARGYFEILDASILDCQYGRTWNPLLALEAYYSFLAKVHATYVNTGIDYSIEYSDYSGVDNQTFTLSKAVFRNNGELLGVVAINIFKTKLPEAYQIDKKTIEDTVQNRTERISRFNALAGINITTCLNKASNEPCNQTANISNIVCLSDLNSDNTTMRNLSCCNCTDVAVPPALPPAPAAGAEKPRDLRLALGLGLGLGIATLTTLAVIAWFCFQRNRHPVPDVFCGDDDDVKHIVNNDRADR